MKLLSSLHDAVFLSVDSTQTPERLTLIFRTTKGSFVKITLTNCSIFRVVDFVKQNIVSRAICYGVEDAYDNAVASQLDWMTSLSDATSYLTSEAKEKILKEISTSLTSMFVIVPSYGAELSALYEQLQIEE